MKEKQIKDKRLNRWSYVINMLITVPVFSYAIAIGRSVDYVQHEDEKGLVAIAQILSMILAVVIVVWTVRRLHDLGKKGWFALFLIPPFTILLWAYLLIGTYDKSSNNRWGVHSELLRLFGIKAKGAWRLLAIMGIFLVMTYLWVILYAVASSL